MILSCLGVLLVLILVDVAAGLPDVDFTAFTGNSVNAGLCLGCLVCPCVFEEMLVSCWVLSGRS